MGKRERKISAIKKYIGNVAGNWDGYSYGNIPSNILSNACKNYGGAINKNDVLGLVDTTAFGSGKTGLIFAENKVYYNYGFLGSKGALSYQRIYDSGSISTDVYGSSINEEALKELLSQLAAIEGETVSGTVSEMNDALHDLEGTIGEIGEVIDTGKRIFSTIFGGSNMKWKTNVIY